MFILLFMCFLQVIAAYPPAISKIYRTDYVYSKRTEAFYKLHIDATSFAHAKNLCLLEGAKMLVLSSDWEYNEAYTLMKKYPDINHVWVGYDGHNHTEVDGKIIEFGGSSRTDNIYSYSYEDVAKDEDAGKCDVLSKSGGIRSECCSCGFERPFICKVAAKDAPYDKACDVYDTGYEYIPTVRSCYKIPKVAASWNLAYAECHAVGSHLVVLNSEAEHLAVKNFMQKSKDIENSHHNYYFNAGFRTRGHSRDFVTIFNQTLEQAGYTQWTISEPNNYDNNEYCGSLFRADGKLNDINCHFRFGFICEKEVQRSDDVTQSQIEVQTTPLY